MDKPPPQKPSLEEATELGANGMNVGHAIAAIGSIRGMMNLLEVVGYPVDSRTADGRTSLHIASDTISDTHWVFEDMVKLLLMNGANPNAIDQQGKTPGHYAAQSANTKVLQILLYGGLNPFVVDGSGASIFQINKKISLKLPPRNSSSYERLMSDALAAVAEGHDVRQAEMVLNGTKKRISS